MAASGADKAFGTTIQKSGGTALAELTSISGPNITTETIDVTSHDSDNTYREYISGVFDGGEINVEGLLQLGSAGQSDFITDAQDGSGDSYTITYSNTEASTWVATCIVTSFEIIATYDDALKWSGTLKVTGKPAFTV